MKRLLLTFAALAVMATGAQAEVLWDQSDYDAVGQAGMWNAVSGCAPFGGSIHYANDVTIYDMVTVNSVTTWFTAFNFETESTVEAYLYIGPKTGPLPVNGVDLPQEDGTLVPVTMVNVDGVYQCIASGLSIMLTPGEYWVSLTPIMPGGAWGPDFGIRALATVGEPGAWYEYCGQFAPSWTTNLDGWDPALLIEGTIDAVPTESTSLSELKAQF